MLYNALRIDSSENACARFTSRRFDARLVRKAGRIRRDRAAIAAICVVLSSYVDGKCGTRHRVFIITLADVHILTFRHLVNATMISVFLAYTVCSTLAQRIDETTCRVASSAALRVPMITSEWSILAPSSRYQSSFTTITNNSVIRVLPTPTVDVPLAAIEYRLPTPPAFSSNMWAYDVVYSVAQAAKNTSSSRLGLGAWHTIGFDWGEPGDALDLTSIRYSTGGNEPGSVPRPYTTLMRFAGDGDCATPNDDSRCAFVEWQNMTTPDTQGETRQMKYRFILDEAHMYPVRVQSNFGEVKYEERFASARIPVPIGAARRPPARLVLVVSATGLLVFHMNISVVELDCPSSSSTTRLSVSTQSSTSTMRQSAAESLSQSTERDTATPSLVESRQAIASTRRSTDSSSSDVTSDTVSITSPPMAPSSLAGDDRQKTIDSITQRIDTANWTANVVSVVVCTVGSVGLVIVCAFVAIRVRKSESWQKWYHANLTRHQTQVVTASQIYGPITFATDPPTVVYEKLPPSSVYATVPSPSDSKIYDSPTSPFVN